MKKLSANNSGAPKSSVHAENIIWIFGMIRTGSTWLGAMMGDLEGHEMWNEPRVGELFGVFFLSVLPTAGKTTTSSWGSNASISG